VNYYEETRIRVCHCGNTHNYIEKSILLLLEIRHRGKRIINNVILYLIQYEQFYMCNYNRRIGRCVRDIDLLNLRVTEFPYSFV